MLPHPFSLHIACQKRVGISLAKIVRKNNALHHYPTPTLSRVCITSLQNDYSRSRQVLKLYTQ